MSEMKKAHDEMLERAKGLLPKLTARVPEADRLRRIPDETIADFQEAGFFKILQPSRWGGLELDPKTFFDVQASVATACPSSAWVLGVVAVHNWQLALFPLEAQEDVWGKDRSVLISSSYAPTGKVVKADGGYKISGRWSFSSGCDHARWVFLGGFVPVEGGPPDMRTFLVPRADYQIDDNWHVAGLKGTGSKDIVIESAFVPEHRTHKLMDGFFRKSPGNAANPAPLFKLPFGQVFIRSVSTTALGIAQGMLDAYRAVAAKRVAAGDGAKVAEDPNAQIVAARAASLIDETRLVLHRNMDELIEIARTGAELSLERRVRYRYDSSNAVSKCMEAVDLLFTASGGRAIFLNSPLLRYFLDIHAARAHYVNGPDKPARNLGGVLLDLKNADFFL